MPADRLCLMMVPSRHAYLRARARSDAPGIRRGAARSGIRSIHSKLVHPGSHCKKLPESQVPRLPVGIYWGACRWRVPESEKVARISRMLGPCESVTLSLCLPPRARWRQERRQPGPGDKSARARVQRKPEGQCPPRSLLVLRARTAISRPCQSLCQSQSSST
jgi:hypothetical protein